MAWLLLPSSRARGVPGEMTAMANAVLHRIDTTLNLIEQDFIPHVGEATRLQPKPAPCPLSFNLITTVDGFDALEQEWTDLLDHSTQPWQVFQSFNWNWHWTRHYVATATRRGARLAIVTGRSNGRLVLILPLALNRIAGLKQLSWMGEPVSQYGDVIALTEASDLASISAAFAFAIAETRADVANLRKVRADATVSAWLAQHGSTITMIEEAPFMSLSSAPDMETYENRHPSKRRKNRRRQMRRLEERGPVAFEKHEGTDDAACLADYAVRMKRASLSGRGQVAPSLADPRFAAFFADAAHGRGRPVGCHVMTLKSNGEITAMQISLERGHHRFLHVAVFAGKFEKCGTGALLLEKAIADCFDHGIATFDMLAPKHEYKMDFADGTVAVRDHALAFSRAGRTYVATFLGLRANLKKAIESLPPPARRLVGDAIAFVRRRG